MTFETFGMGKMPLENTVPKGQCAGNLFFFSKFHNIFFPKEDKVNALSNVIHLSSSNVFSLVKAKILSSGAELTHSHTITPFDAPGKQAF